MRRFFAVVTATLALAPTLLFVGAPVAQAFGIDGQEAQLIICTHSGYSQSRTRSCVANVLNGDHLSRPGARCLLTAVGTTFGAVIGGAIGGAAARGIAGAVIGGGAGACLNILVN